MGFRSEDRIEWDKDGEDMLQPQEISVSHLFDHTMSSKATCACTELALAANHVCLGKDRNVCVCVCVCVCLCTPCVYYGGRCDKTYVSDTAYM